MKKHYWVILIIFFIIFGNLNDFFKIRAQAQVDLENLPYVEGEILAKFKIEIPLDQLKEILKQYGVEEIIHDFIISNLGLLKLKEGYTVEGVMKELSHLPYFNYLEPNFYQFSFRGILPWWPGKSEPQPDPNTDDPYFYKSYGVKKIGATEVWKITPGKREIMVAVIDSGIDYNHEDLKDNLWRNPKEIPDNRVDDDQNGYIDDIFGWDFVNNDNLPYDRDKHGSHVSGIIGAVGGNQKGTSGVCQKISIMTCQFLDSKGRGTTEGAIRSIGYAISNGARIINASWGGEENSKALKEAINLAAQAGILFVAACGNDTQNNDQRPVYPASYPIDNIISVAATDQDDQLATFSNFGVKTVHLTAPGKDIYSTIPDSNYTQYSGTSMAAPHVAGAAALLLSYNSGFSFLDLKNRLILKVDKIPRLQDKVQSGGRVNVLKALQE